MFYFEIKPKLHTEVAFFMYEFTRYVDQLT
jgi:hypothetical protein